MKASANIFPLVEFAEAAAPATPAAGQVRIYAKADGLMYSKDDAGVETPLGAGGGGTGDVVGPASSTDSHVALFDGITGKLLKDGGALPAALTDGDKGDITVSASGATWTIDANAISTAKVADDAITYAKLQNVSATDMLLGRSTAGAGNAEEIPCTAFARSILDDVDAAAVRTTIGVGTGTGDVVGPVSAVDDRIATFDGTTGELIQDGGKTIAELRAPAIQSVTSSATVTPTFADDMVKITAQAAALALANPTGTAIPGLGMVIRIKDNGTARAITYDTQYRAIGITLPTTTVISKTTYIAMIYNSDDTMWDCIATGTQA